VGGEGGQDGGGGRMSYLHSILNLRV
jgi:hypothetical protein